jgi:hypothetical protein
MTRIVASALGKAPSGSPVGSVGIYNRNLGGWHNANAYDRLTHVGAPYRSYGTRTTATAIHLKDRTVYVLVIVYRGVWDVARVTASFQYATLS